MKIFAIVVRWPRRCLPRVVLARAFALGTVLATCVLPARAETGVSDGRVSIPAGPGSVAGAGENLSVSNNMGAMVYTLPLALPAGFPGASPAIALQYNSLSGNSEIGMGWDLSVPHIERFTRRGLPRYTSADAFAANGTDELVRVASDGRAHTYRARVEGGFVRYTWHAKPGADYWVAEYPDGSRGYFGADRFGRVQDAARLTRPGTPRAVFRYALVEQVDVLGHRVEYIYRKYEGYPLLSELRYLFHRDVPGVRVAFDYGHETRPDVVSSALAGFETRLTRRLLGIQLAAGGKPALRYVLSYEQAAAGISRLRKVEQLGREGGLSPVAFSFSYTSSLDLACGECERPFLLDLGKLDAEAGAAVDLQNGRSTLVDINGDSLPDVLDTTAGVHRVFLNQMNAAGGHVFAPGHVSAAVDETGTSQFRLEEPGVQLVDLNGDGFSDIFNATTGEVLCNDGRGDWVPDGDCQVEGLPTGLSADAAGDPEPKARRFMDYDGDRRMDLLITYEGGTFVWHNLPHSGNGDSQEVKVDTLGKVFDVDRLQLADLNGDGLLDPIEISPGGQVWYRLNLGLGHWGNRGVTQLQASGLRFDDVELQDLNGDGLDDIVVVGDDSVHYALNRSSLRSETPFGAFQTVTSRDVIGGLPEYDRAVTTILFADVNGSGSTDVIWAEASGRVRALELFAIRPNLLTRIENGLGGVQSVEYGTSAREQARDEEQGVRWRHRLPQAMNVMTATELFSQASPNVRLRTQWSYRHGYYDGEERRYSGFESVEQRRLGTPQEEVAVSRLKYDVEDLYLQGKALEEELLAETADGLQPLRHVRHAYESCALAGIPSGTSIAQAVRFPCEVATVTTLKERRPAKEWVTLRTEQQFDGYGNLTRTAELGVVGADLGGSPCGSCDAPEGTHSGACGPQCLGDERYTQQEYISPGPATEQRWILGRPSRIQRSGATAMVRASDPPGQRAQRPLSETWFYYDGAAFEGQRAGTLRQGLVTRICQRIDAGAAPECSGEGWVQPVRVERDPHGNVVSSLDALGSPDSFAGHRRSYEYDDTYGRQLKAEKIFLSRAGQPYRLQRKIGYHEVFFEKPTWVSRWMREGHGPRDITRIAYDEFGRQSAVFQPGDRADAPSQRFEYELSAPLSRVRVRSRARAGGPMDLEAVQCLDGLGHNRQTRVRVREGAYQVKDAQDRSPTGRVLRRFQSYVATSGECEELPPPHVLANDYSYDASARLTRTSFPDHRPSAGRGTETFEYLPLQITRYDAEDNDADRFAHGTPERTYRDGLGRTILRERVLQSEQAEGAASAVEGSLRALWDSQGNLAGYQSTNGSIKRQRYDLAGRLVEVDDPNAGRTRFRYDAVGNLVLRTDARGVSERVEYDGSNRAVLRFDPSKPERAVETLYDFSPGCNDCRAGGRVVSVRYPLLADAGWGSDTYAYDARGLRARHIRTLQGYAFVSHYRYDNAGRLREQTSPDGTVLKFHRDGASRLEALPGILEEVRFEDRGAPSDWLLANGIRQEFSYDPLGRPSGRRDVMANGELVLGLDLERDRVGTVHAVHDLTDPKAGRLGREVRYEHDAWYRTTLSAYGSEVVAVSFGLEDNIRRRVSSLGAESVVHVGAYGYAKAQPNAVRKVRDETYAYDAAGHLVRRGRTSLEWDSEGRLVEARTGRGDWAQYGYAGNADRAMEVHGGSVTYRIGPDFEVRDGIAFTYARVGDQRVARLSNPDMAPKVLHDGNGDGQIDVHDAWRMRSTGGDPERHLWSSARRLLREREGGLIFLHGDHLGNLVLATAPDGSVRGERTFYSTGSEQGSRGFVDVHGFTGQRQDPTTGLVSFRYRELDPVAGRWTGVDPLFATTEGSHLARWGEADTGYAYVAGRFATAVDPEGLALRDMATVIATSVVAIGGAYLMSRFLGFGDPPDVGAAERRRSGRRKRRVRGRTPHQARLEQQEFFGLSLLPRVPVQGRRPPAYRTYKSRGRPVPMPTIHEHGRPQFTSHVRQR